MHTQPYTRKDRNTIHYANPDDLVDHVHPAWWAYSDRIAASKRKRENALNEAYTRRVSEAAYLSQYDAIWDIFNAEVQAARAEYEAAVAVTPAHPACLH